MILERTNTVTIVYGSCDTNLTLGGGLIKKKKLCHSSLLAGSYPIPSQEYGGSILGSGQKRGRGPPHRQYAK